MSPPTFPLLAVANLSVRQGAVLAVAEAHLQVAAGEIVALLGPNGAGKSSLVRAILGLAPVERGSIRFDGRELTLLAPEARARLDIGYVPEGRRVFASLTVRENLDVAAFAPAAERARRRARTLAIFPALEPHLGRRAWQLSGGQQQMLSIGRALMAAPRLLVLDEPTQGLAPALIEGLFAALQAIAKEGTAVLLAEQNAAAALSVAGRAALMAEGRILRYDSAEALRRDGAVLETLFGVA